MAPLLSLANNIICSWDQQKVILIMVTPYGLISHIIKCSVRWDMYKLPENIALYILVYHCTLHTNSVIDWMLSCLSFYSYHTMSKSYSRFLSVSTSYTLDSSFKEISILGNHCNKQALLIINNILNKFYHKFIPKNSLQVFQ